MSQADIKALGRALVDWAETEANLREYVETYDLRAVFTLLPAPWKREDGDA